jgi:hypothetical protein
VITGRLFRTTGGHEDMRLEMNNNRLRKARKARGAFEETNRTSPLVNDHDLVGQGGFDGDSPPPPLPALREQRIDNELESRQ